MHKSNMSGENFDDWLWECALLPLEKDRTTASQTKYLVPDWEEEAHHFVPSKNHQLHHTARVFPSNSSNTSSTDVVISVVEIRGNGVLDTIGGEVWEASLLLCAYILLNPQGFLSVSSLELGSGLGLPVFLITELRRLLLHLHSTSPSTPSSSYAAYRQQGKRTCLTDNDPRCIDTLIATVKTRYDENTSMMMSSANHCYLSVATLDWSAYRNRTTTSTVTEVDSHQTIDSPTYPSTTSELSTEDPLHPKHYQLLFGSALIYSPYHVCLADTILHYMQAGACQRVCIVQIADRAGFEEFLHRLTGLKIQYSVEPISEDVYHTAQRISCNSSSISVSATAASSHISQSNMTVPVSCPTVHSNLPVKCDHVQSIDEDEVQIEKHFVFPGDLIRQAIEQCVLDPPVQQTQVTKIPTDDTDPVTDTLITLPETVQPVMTGKDDNGWSCCDRVHGVGLIHTDRNAFVMVHAWL